MILPNDATVAVADGSKIRLFRNKGVEPHIRLVELPRPDVRSGNTGSGSRHHSATGNPDAGRLREDDFAAAASAWLNRQVLDGSIQKLFVIADPRTLGEMRRHFSPRLAAGLVGELARDLTSHGVGDIEAAVGHA